ncbi:hypothetical protein SAMN06265361_103261 [Laceyella tengchongensis]|jgi:hypothetical protein|uniref:Uncharacterized protein n=1 Tax=Laceyella tengchongensis TaxID=574699 RepID=A0AA45WP62_9BACL|nr:hypothetical protein SAMN06265361_103261 [Laceyella tengchongensis]
MIIDEVLNSMDEYVEIKGYTYGRFEFIAS